MFMKSIAALGFVASSLALTITSPSGSNFWVQFSSNVIDWQFSSGDPSPVDITVTNSNSSILNGAFSIARNLDASTGSFTVTNVTLRVADGYVVNFVNSTNETQIFTSSSTFQVEKPGTPPSAAANSTNTASGSSATQTSASSSNSSSSNSSGSATTSSARGGATTGAASQLSAYGLVGQGVTGLAASGVVALLAGFAMF